MQTACGPGSYAVLAALLVSCDGGREVASPPSPPAIARQPASLSVVECGSASFFVSARGTDPMRYQWMANGQPIPGAVESSYSLSRAGRDDDGTQFSVAVMNAAGTATSAPAVLTVSPVDGPLLLSDGPVLGIAAAATELYWSDGNRIRAAANDCRGPLRTLYERVGAVENTYAVTVVAGRVAWTDQAGGAVRCVDASGGPSVTLASGLGGGGPLSIASVNGTELVWPNLIAGMQLVSVDGGPVVTIPVHDVPVSVASVASDDLYIYWTDLQLRTVNRMPIAGTDFSVLATAAEQVGAIAAGGGYVFWSTFVDDGTGAPVGRILRLPREGGVADTLATRSKEVVQLTVDELNVYWTESLLRPYVANSGAVMKVPLDGSAQETAVASGMDLPGSIAMDPQFVYWSDRRGLMRARK